MEGPIVVRFINPSSHSLVMMGVMIRLHAKIDASGKYAIMIPGHNAMFSQNSPAVRREGTQPRTRSSSPGMPQIWIKN